MKKKGLYFWIPVVKAEQIDCLLGDELWISPLVDTDAINRISGNKCDAFRSEQV